MNDCKSEIEKQISSTEKDAPLKPYCKPCLEELGDLRTKTLGASPGMCESGAFKDPIIGC
jgi:hypothetical protein